MLGKAVFRDFYRIFSCALFALVFVVFSLFSAWAEEEPDYKFTLTTTTLPIENNTYVFEFQLSATGIFYVDCDGGTLSGTGVSGNTITRTSTTNETYKCVYQSSDARDIRFGGEATAYSDTGDTVHPNLFVATISFEISNTKVASISGDLSAVFPIKGSADSEKPKFKRTFAGCTNISSIPGNLFSSYESGGIAIFEETFIGCTGLTQIPSSLFANIETGATHMFKGTFSGCANLGAIPENLFTSITSSGYKMYYETFYGCTNLTLPENFKFFGGTDISGAEYMFEETFYGCQSLTSLPAGMFSNIISGAKMMFFQTFINCTNLQIVPEGFKFINSNSSVSGQDSMFAGTFYGCESLESVPSDVFGRISTGATWMFKDTFYGCTSLTTMPTVSFSEIISSAKYMFDGTFNGCSSLTGYIPIAMFKALIDHQSPYALDMMKNIFAGTNLATECPTGTTPYTTGYEEYWDGKVACQSGDGGYTYPFSVTVKPVTTSDRFTFTISAKGTFYVYCGDGGQLYGEDAAASTVSGVTITKNNTDTYRYGCYFIGVNQRDVKFGGLATEYADDAAALSFNGSGGSLILSADGNLSSIFPYKGSADGQSPRFKEMFKSCSRLSSISANLFSGYTVGVSSMFEYTFQTCTSLTQIPESLFSSFTSGANSMFLGTFYGCSSLQSIPENLFSFGSTPNNPVYIDGANDMFLWTFLRCTEVQTIPAGLFAHIKSGALRMFSETFRECTGITSIPEDFKFGNDNMTSSQSMFVGTFNSCTGLTSLPSGMFSNIKTGSHNMFNRTFIGCTGLRYLPENLFANITTSANNMFGETFKDCTGFIANPSATNPAEKYNFIPPTMFQGLIDNYSAQTTNVMNGIFDGTTLSTACPDDIPQYITGYEDYWDSHVSCKPCSPGSHLLSGSRICGYDITYNCGKGSGSVPIGMTATDNTSFTPAENTCTAPTNAIFGGWLVSGTEDIKSAGDTFIWEYTEDKTFTAQWYCDKANNYWWDSVNNECVLGYEIDLTQSSKTEWDNAPVPSKLYTIKNVGVYLDENRTQKMTTSANRVQVPTVNSFVVKYDTNAPKNPVTGNKYESSSVENQTLSITYNGSGVNDKWIDSGGYITEDGLQRALSLSDNESWPALDYVWESSDVRNAASLDNDGYVFEAWYDNPEGEGEEISQLSSDEHPEKLYAKWSSYNYYIRYYNYFCDRSGDWIMVGDGEEWYDIDQEITVEHPTLEGHIFQGWNITNMDDSEHYYSNSPIFIDDVYQSTTTQTTNATSLDDVMETHFMNLRTTTGTVSFTADWACDVANYWHPTSDNTPADGNGPCTPCTNRYIIRYVVQDLPAPYSTYISSNYSDLQNAYQYATVGTENIDLIYNVPNVSSFISYRYRYTTWVCTDSNGEIVPVSDNKILEMPPSAVTCTTTWECNGNYHMNTNGDSCVPNTYDVIYNPGLHAASGSTNYTDTNGATYDSPYAVLSFNESPINEHMSAATGWKFVGWTTDDSTPTFTNGSLDNEYTGDSYWKRTSALTLYAAYACDSENGYHLVNGECVLNTYTVTYYSGNCDPNNVENLFGNTYSATDSNLAVSGQTYNVLSYTNTSLVGDNFGQMYSDNGFGVPYACASFHGWNNPNIQGTNIDYDNCFSEQNGLCTPVIQSYNYEENLNLYAYCEWSTWKVAYYGCDGKLITTQLLKYGDSFLVPSASDISGYTFNGWVFKSGGNNINLGDTFPADLCLKGYNPLNLYADCTPNVYPVNLKWVADGDTYNQNPDTCDYGTSTISGISHPDIPGYTFTGWKVSYWWDEQQGLSNFDMTENGNAYYAKAEYNGETYCYFETISNVGYIDCSNNVVSDLNNNEWKVLFDYGTVYGHAKCSSSHSNGSGMVPSDTAGQYCWCQATDFATPAESNKHSLGTLLWFEEGDRSTIKNCWQVCAFTCAQDAYNNNVKRASIFGQTE